MYLRYTIFFVAILSITSCKKSSNNYSIDYDLQFSGRNRKNILHVPKSYFDRKEPASLIIALHGGLGTPKNIEDQSKLSFLSDREGFIVCYPQGLAGRTWNGGNCCGGASQSELDDVGFIDELIDQLLTDYNIDPKRVYVTGMSNGGFMSYRLACELSNKIAAIAPVAGTMAIDQCNPENPMPIIHFHSYQDRSIPLEGGVGEGISRHYNPPVDSVLSVWSSFNNCQLTDSLFYSGEDYDHIVWYNCNNEAIIEAYFTQDGGHQWPMGEKPTKDGDEPSQVINANELMWAFFQAHPKQ